MKNCFLSALQQHILKDLGPRITKSSGYIVRKINNKNSLFQSPVPTVLTMEGVEISRKQEVFNLIGRLPGHLPAHNREFCILWKVFIKSPENISGIITKLR